MNEKMSQKSLMKDLATDIEKLKRDLFAARSKNGVTLSQETYTEMEERYGLCPHHFRIKTGEERVQTLEDELEGKLQELSHLQTQFQRKSEMLDTTQKTLKETSVLLCLILFV